MSFSENTVQNNNPSTQVLVNENDKPKIELHDKIMLIVGLALPLIALGVTLYLNPGMGHLMIQALTDPRAWAGALGGIVFFVGMCYFFAKAPGWAKAFVVSAAVAGALTNSSLSRL